MTFNQLAILYFCIGLGCAGWTIVTVYTSKKKAEAIRAVVNSQNSSSVTTGQKKSIYIISTIMLLVIVTLFWPITITKTIVDYFKEKNV